MMMMMMDDDDDEEVRLQAATINCGETSHVRRETFSCNFWGTFKGYGKI